MGDFQIEPKRFVAAVVAIKPTVVNEPAIRLALGTSYATSLTEVANAMGATLATVKHTWRPAGMPGNSRQRVYPWADILIWYLNRNTAPGRPSTVYDDADRKELAQLQLASARVDLELRQNRIHKSSGNYIDRRSVMPEVSMALACIRDSIMEIPDQISPHLPERQAATITEFVDGLCRAALNQAADKFEAMIEENIGVTDDVESE